jgi:hypothetical protein
MRGIRKVETPGILLRNRRVATTICEECEVPVMGNAGIKPGTLPRSRREKRVPAKKKIAGKRRETARRTREEPGIGKSWAINPDGTTGRKASTTPINRKMRWKARIREKKSEMKKSKTKKPRGETTSGKPRGTAGRKRRRRPPSDGVKCRADRDPWEEIADEKARNRDAIN